MLSLKNFQLILKSNISNTRSKEITGNKATQFVLSAQVGLHDAFSMCHNSHGALPVCLPGTLYLSLFIVTAS